MYPTGTSHEIRRMFRTLCLPSTHAYSFTVYEYRVRSDRKCVKHDRDTFISINSIPSQVIFTLSSTLITAIPLVYTVYTIQIEQQQYLPSSSWRWNCFQCLLIVSMPKVHFPKVDSMPPSTTVHFRKCWKDMICWANRKRKYILKPYKFSCVTLSGRHQSSTRLGCTAKSSFVLSEYAIVQWCLSMAP